MTQSDPWYEAEMAKATAPPPVAPLASPLVYRHYNTDEEIRKHMRAFYAKHNPTKREVDVEFVLQFARRDGDQALHYALLKQYGASIYKVDPPAPMNEDVYNALMCIGITILAIFVIIGALYVIRFSRIVGNWVVGNVQCIVDPQCR